MPKVSVIIPIYKVEEYIERCVRSLFEQTIDDIEYLFIDDCSPDNSIAILKRVLDDYAMRKPQVVIHRMEKNSGQAAVRKWGMQNASGDYIIHCDSDDWVEKGMYSAMYEKALEEDADLVVCDYIVHDGKKVMKYVRGCHTKDFLSFEKALLLQKEKWALWNKLFRRAILKDDIIYPVANMGEDMVLTIQMVMRSHKMAYISQGYYYYYFNKMSITQKRDASVHIRNYKDMLENTNMLIELLNRWNVRHKCWIINKLQYSVTKNLYYVMHNNARYRYLWLNTYPGFHWLYMINPYSDIKCRIKILLAFIGIYPFPKNRL